MVNVSVHTEGRYAFVELRTPDMATASLQLNGQARGGVGAGAGSGAASQDLLPNMAATRSGGPPRVFI